MMLGLELLPSVGELLERPELVLSDPPSPELENRLGLFPRVAEERGQQME